jgi:hypothetical protein
MWLTVKGFRPTPLTTSGTHTSAATPPRARAGRLRVLSRRSTMRARNTRRLSRPVAATRRPCVGCCVAAAGAVTRIAPMIWLPGNHDSPETVGLMRSVPGVTVLGTKTADGSGGFQVGVQQMIAYGLTIAAMPDPRVYGGGGDFRAAVGHPPHPSSSAWNPWLRAASSPRSPASRSPVPRRACQPASPPASCRRSPHRPATSNPRISLGPANATLASAYQNRPNSDSGGASEFTTNGRPSVMSKA